MQLGLIPKDIDFLGVGDVSSLCCIIMSKGPICRVDAILIIVYHVIDKEMVVVGVEENSDGFVLMARDEIKVAFAGELVDLEDAPD